MQPSQAPAFAYDFSNLKQLAARASHKPQQSLKQVASDFEALFIQRLLHEMRASKLGPNLMSGEVGSSMYRGMLDSQLSQVMASQDPFGLAKLLEQQLGKPAASHSGSLSTGEPIASGLPTVSRPNASSAVSSAAAAPTVAPSRNSRAKATSVSASQAGQFVRHLLPAVKQAAEMLSVSPLALLSQAALETGWGKHVPETTTGRSSHNLFGVKAGTNWSGPVVSAKTVEYRHQKPVKVQADFRAYGSVQDSVQDFAKVASTLVGDVSKSMLTAAQWGHKLMQAGYATDPEYAQKLAAVAHSNLMQKAFHQVQASLKPGALVSLLQSLEEGIASHAR